MKMYNVGNPGADHPLGNVPTVKKMGADGKVREYVKVPESFGRDQLVEHKPGNVYVPISGVGFFTVPRDGFFEVPGGISMKAITGLAPHLVSEEEYLHAKQSAPVAAAPEPEMAPLPPAPDLVIDSEPEGPEPVMAPAEKPRRGRPPNSR
jgi:hypothetical protein